MEVVKLPSKLEVMFPQINVQFPFTVDPFAEAVGIWIL